MRGGQGSAVRPVLPLWLLLRTRCVTTNVLPPPQVSEGHAADELSGLPGPDQHRAELHRARGLSPPQPSATGVAPLPAAGPDEGVPGLTVSLWGGQGGPGRQASAGRVPGGWAASGPSQAHLLCVSDAAARGHPGDPWFQKDCCERTAGPRREPGLRPWREAPACLCAWWSLLAPCSQEAWGPRTALASHPAPWWLGAGVGSKGVRGGLGGMIKWGPHAVPPPLEGCRVLHHPRSKGPRC